MVCLMPDDNNILQGFGGASDHLAREHVCPFARLYPDILLFASFSIIAVLETLDEFSIIVIGVLVVLAAGAETALGLASAHGGSFL